MDRGMKVMFGMMTAAIFLMAANMFVSNSPQAYAMSAGDRGPEPTIVSFRVTPISRELHDFDPNDGRSWAWGNNPTSWILLTRMWSDGTVEMNIVGNETIPAGNMQGESFTGWITVTDSVAGFACSGDTDGNRDVDVIDLLAVIDDWGSCEEPAPVNIPEDEDM